MRGKILVSCIVAALSGQACAGDIFRCVAANGEVIYTNMACPTDSQVQHVASYEPVPDTPAPAYDAAAAAASALEAREAARQARAAAYQAQALYEEARTEVRSEQSYGGPEYAAQSIAVYPLSGLRFRNHRHHSPQALVTRPAMSPPHHTVVTPQHMQNAVFAGHR